MTPSSLVQVHEYNTHIEWHYLLTTRRASDFRRKLHTCVSTCTKARIFIKEDEMPFFCRTKTIKIGLNDIAKSTYEQT